MNVRYRVELSQAERDELTALLSGGKHAARKLKRAQILLAADAGRQRRGDRQQTVGVGGSTVYRTKRRFVLGNLEAALSEEPRPGAARKLSGKEEALLVATACSKPPAGRARWTLELLAGEMVKLTEHGELSRETVRRRLAENDLKPWRRDMWCIPEVDGTYVARMEDVLDLYAEAARSEAAGGVLRREPDPADRRGAPADPGHAGPARALRLRVSPQRHGQPVRLPRRPPALAHGQGHRPAHRRATSPTACAISSISTIPRPSRSASCSTICRPIRRAPSTRPSRRPRRIASCAAWSSTTPQSTPAGSTWSRSRSACCAASASTAASATAKRLEAEIAAWERQRNADRRPHQMDVHHSARSHQTAARLSRSRPRSHNLCAEVLASHGLRWVWARTFHERSDVAPNFYPV